MGELMKIGPKYQVVIPSIIRKKINLRPYDEVLIENINNTIIIIPKPPKCTELMIGLGKEIWSKIEVKDYIKKERDSWK
jgi:AbrB family looped-hinge helix DNA binding protein